MSINKVVISGTGLYTPAESITNEELVESFNQYVDQFNANNAALIQSGEMEALRYSSAEFIEKASGIKRRYVVDKQHILDNSVMQPLLPRREDEALSLQAEMCMYAAKNALSNARLRAEDIDLVIVACSNFQRAYPAIAIEVQHALGIEGSAYDMNVACSSATFGIQNAYSMVASGVAQRVLVLSPEICTAHINFTDRDCHFIFGDACSAVVIEAASSAKSIHRYEILTTKSYTQYSNNIRNNFGFLIKTDPGVVQDSVGIFARDTYFMQEGRKVFKDIIPAVANMILDHLSEYNIKPSMLKRLWLHQANANINRLVAEKIFGTSEVDVLLAPTILDEYANTSSPGCIIAFHKYHEDLISGDIGVLCSFGAGYSIGSVIVQKL